jgi:putative nucleotidyltransferase with HDIG domain
MLPRERKFAYEYSKGSPWAYDELTARFGFSIQKTPAELQQERDSVLRKITPYFTYDAFIYADRLNAFKTNFDKKWIAYAMDEYRIDNEQKYLESSRYNSLRMLQDYYHSFIYSNLEQTYLKGIIRIPDTDEFTLTDDSFISVVKGQISEKVLLEQLYTEREAYQLLSDVLNEEAENDMRKQIARFKPFLETFDLSDYLQANVLYDQNKSNLERTAQLKTISETKGYIQEGELLISRGIIVTSETFQILESYKYEFEKQRGNVSDILAWSGRFLLAFISFMVVYLFLYNFRHEVLESLVKTSFILFMMVLMIFIASMVSSYEKKFYYVVPFTILPIIIRTFYDERVGLFIHIITVLLAGFMALNSFDFIFLNIIAGMVALFTLTNLYHRSRFFVSALLVVLSYSITYFGISVVKEGSFSQLDWSNFGYFGLNGVFTLLSFLLIYFFEKTFGFLSDTTLMELSDTNQPLLRKLAENAPATFQHSMQVANLSEEAIRHIGGNPLLVRTGALYHDIGKMVDASYFIENQMGGTNPHKDKDLKESAKIIINHVKLGEEMALKNKLPKPIIDFILMHHGTSTAKWFYKTYQNQHPDEEVDKKDFQYPGPSPLTKETAVLMMADTVEAASRSLESYSKESISELVERLIDNQMEEGQFEDADITFKEIKKVKEVFKSRLNTIYHARISYPK